MAWLSFLILFALGNALSFFKQPKHRLVLIPLALVSLFVGYLALDISHKHAQVSVFETDFAEYCVAVINFENPELTPAKRSRMATLLSWTLHQFLPLIDALSWASILSAMGCFLGIFFWAFLVGGAWSGLIAVGVACFMSPLVLMPRFLTFYPEIVAVTIFAAASIVALFHFRTVYAALLAGVGVGLCLLIDARGLVWGFPYCFGAILSLICWKEPAKKKAILLFAFILPIWLSWFIGWWSFPSYAASLEKQLDVRPLFVGFDEENPILVPPWTYSSSYVWGRFNLLEFHKTLMFIWEQHQIPVPEGFSSWQSNGGLTKEYLGFWWTILGLSIPIALWNSRRLAFSLFLSALPFVVALNALSTMVEGHLRFYMHAMPAIAVCLGVAIGGISKNHFVKYRRYPFWLGGFGLVVIFGIGIAVIGSPLKMNWILNASDLKAVQYYAQNQENKTSNDWVKECGEHLREEGQWHPTAYSD